MTGEQIVEAAKAETTLKITWLKLVGAGLGAVGLAFGGGTLGVSTTASSNAAVVSDLAKVVDKLATRILVVEGLQDRELKDHLKDGQYGKVLDGFNRMALEFSSGKSQHFLLVDDVKRNAAEISSTRRDISKLVEGVGELKSDVRHMMRTIEKKH